jgi:hypothetical protein
MYATTNPLLLLLLFLFFTYLYFITSPYELLQDEDSIFYKMCYNSGELDGLLTTAKEKHELLEI